MVSKYYYLLVLAFFCFTAENYAQNSIPAEINWGEEYKEPSKSALSRIIGSDEKYYYTLRRKYGMQGNQEVYIEKYSLDGLKLIKANAVNLKFQKKLRSFHELLKVNDDIFLITSYLNKAKKKNYLFAQKFKSNLEVSDDLIKIGEMDIPNIAKEGIFDIEISRDSSKILVYHDLPHRGGENERLALSIYDSEFNELWNKEISIPYPDKQFTFEEYRISNEGDVFLLGVKFYDGANIRRRGKPNYEYLLLTYLEEGSRSKEYSLKDPSKFITDLTFEPTRKGEIVCSGFYSEKSAYTIKGTFFMRINILSEDILVNNFKQFDFDFVTINYSESKKNRAEKAALNNNKNREAELCKFALDDLILRSDGGALLIAEQYFVEEYFTNTGFQPGIAGGINDRVYEYNYNDIIVVNINPDGSIAWSTLIPKTQVTTNDGGYFSSYSKAIVNDKIYFVYNNNRRNFDSERSGNFNFDGRQSIIALTAVNKDGEFRTYPLYDNRDADILTRPKVCEQVGKRKMLIYGEKNRRFKFASLTF